MDGTGFASESEAEFPERMARGHREGDPVRYRTDREIMAVAGGLRSNAVDLLRYVEAQPGPPETELERRCGRPTRFGSRRRAEKELDTVSRGASRPSRARSQWFTMAE